MPGMNSGLNIDNSTLVTAFRTALLHQGILILAIFAVLAVAWVSAREWLRPPPAARPAVPEPAWRELLRIGFGVLWIIDGLLQGQPGMPAGLPSQVIEPTASSSPGWVQHIVNWAGTTWSYHPIQAGAAAVWIQIGIGVWLIAAPRGLWSRLGGLASVAWGLVVWVFGEAFGGIFAPGLTWLFGAPGAVLFYCAAGALIALPERSWRSPRLGRVILTTGGVFFLGMAVLQAWPGRGFWQGTAHGRPGTLTGMISDMSGTPQPAWLAGWVRGFASFTAAHGFAVNLVAVVALAAIGVVLLGAGLGWPGLGRVLTAPRARPLLLATVGFTIAFCLADWVLIEDIGIFGGLGTDVNSMIPMALLILTGYLALTVAPAPVVEAPVVEAPVVETPVVEAPATATQPATEPAAKPSARPGSPWPSRLRPGRLARQFGSASTWVVLTTWAVAITVIGAAPMAVAQANPNADPIIAEAIAGNSAPLNFPAPAFRLTDQNGTQVSLASLRGKVVLLTFLDPVCTSDCPEIAQIFRGASQVLGASASRVELVAIVTNPLYRSVAYTRAFDHQERLTELPNWLFLTGSLAQLEQAWRSYGIAHAILPAGGMIGHNDVAYVIDANGRTRRELNVDPGPATSSSTSSFAVELTNAARQALKSSS
jgi:cytochrome oxidase Cu insertion factor (SCO1/SenC/PrrC family)